MILINEQPPKPPSLSRNFISFAGIAIVVTSATAILLLFLTEVFSTHEKPYLGILTYMVFPAFLVLGLAVIGFGMLVERRRRRRAGSGESAYLKIDLNDPRRRRSLLVFIAVTFLFVFASAFGSFRAYEYTDSVAFCGQLCHTVMNPEFVAYQASPHARVRCVDCHVGPGAGWYVRSKLSGAYQVYAATLNKFPRPVPTPVHNLRPAQDTCEQCHWPEKFFGAQLKVFNHYGYDEKNTLRQTRMLINTGGGSPDKGLVTGIHWHMNIANQVNYVSTDDHRQSIPWVQTKDRNGNVTEYTLKEGQMSAEELAKVPKHRMDCVDCHNRPTHIYVPPDRSVNEAFLGGKLDTSLPYLKLKAVEALSRSYASTEDANNAIAATLDEYYRTNYANLYAAKKDSIKKAIVEIQRIFGSTFFPEMKVDWQTHPDNVGHYYSQGCFRCHDGKHVSNTGKVIRSDCNICHTTLDQTDGEKSIAVKNGSFQHPLDIDVSSSKCVDCHTGKGLKQE